MVCRSGNDLLPTSETWYNYRRQPGSNEKQQQGKRPANPPQNIGDDVTVVTGNNTSIGDDYEYDYQGE